MSVRAAPCLPSAALSVTASWSALSRKRYWKSQKARRQGTRPPLARTAGNDAADPEKNQQTSTREKHSCSPARFVSPSILLSDLGTYPGSNICFQTSPGNPMCFSRGTLTSAVLQASQVQFANQQSAQESMNAAVPVRQLSRNPSLLSESLPHDRAPSVTKGQVPHGNAPVLAVHPTSSHK